MQYKIGTMGSASMSLTLALLEGPTKAAVASTISAAGLGSVFLGLAPNPALCFTYRQAYDDDIYKVNSASQMPFSFTPIQIPESFSHRSALFKIFCRKLVGMQRACQNLARSPKRKFHLKSHIIKSWCED